MQSYLNILKDVLETGQPRRERTGTGTVSKFGVHARYDLTKGFPLLTTKKVHLRSIIYELLWFLKGDTNVKYLQDHSVTIWDDWADKNGDLGPIYGYQWRSWKNGDKCIDQIADVIEQIKTNPTSRRLIVNAWNVADIDKMALPPCHTLFQFYVGDSGQLSCQLYQRSADLFLGVPFNIASYSLLTMIIAHVCNLVPYQFIHTIGDAHIYSNHIPQVKMQLARQPRKLPTLILNHKICRIEDFRYEDFQLINYEPHPRIKAEIAV